MRVLLTRPISDSQEIAQALRAKGFTVDLEPLMHVEFLPDPKIIIEHFQAIIFTSANGIRAYHNNNYNKKKCFYVVGERSGQVAQSLGLKEVISANGDVNKLSEKIITELKPTNGPLLYLSGAHVSGDLTGDLQRAGFSIERMPLYKTVERNHFTSETKKKLISGSFDYIPFYSPRSALIFKRLIEKAGLLNTLSTVSALCLSQNISNELNRMCWKQILVAKKPTQKDLYDLIGLTL